MPASRVATSACSRRFVRPPDWPEAQLGDAFGKVSRYVSFRPGSRHLVPATSGSAAWCRPRRLPFSGAFARFPRRGPLPASDQPVEPARRLLQRTFDLVQLRGHLIVGATAVALGEVGDPLRELVQ